MTAAHARPRPRTELSPYTGWERSDWAALADRLLLAARRHASPTGARITFPGPSGGYGRAVDGLEGYARTLLLAGFRLAGEAGADPLGLAEHYARGLAAGVDPASPERWVRPTEHGQAKVEAASIALVLDLTRPWLWDRLDPAVQERTVDYLAEVVGDETYPRNNWVWFRLVVEQFLRSVGGPWSRADMEADLAFHESLLRADGWYSDGPERNHDHYVGWALHVYPLLWSRMRDADELAAPWREAYAARLDAYLHDALRLVGGDGAPLAQGRSLTYRFATAAPLWAGALAGVPSHDPGLLRRAASGELAWFVERGALGGPDDEPDVLTLGWTGPWRRIAQHYSGTGSPYWASKGMLGLALPADHPAWTAVEQPLPVERGDVLTVARTPGWAISGTHDDGVVRVVNHGTDHAHEGSQAGDSPLYARLGYSTATFPLLDETAWTDPLDQAVVLLDAAGRASHRAGFRTLEPGLVVPDGARAAVVASRADARWLDAEPAPDYGSGRAGTARPAGTVTTVSVVRGAWEARLVRVATPSPADVRGLRIGGWALADALPPESEVADDPTRPGRDGPARAACRTAGHVSVVVAAVGDPGWEAGVTRSPDASPLGPAATPWLLVRAVDAGRWHAVAVGLAGRAAGRDDLPGGPRVRTDGPTAVVTWPDGAATRVPLPAEET